MMNIKDTPEYALAIALQSWDCKIEAMTIIAMIMRSEKLPGALVNKAKSYIERDCLEQDFAIEILKRNAELSYCPF